jgi:hypothetical protein
VESTQLIPAQESRGSGLDVSSHLIETVSAVKLGIIILIVPDIMINYLS